MMELKGIVQQLSSDYLTDIIRLRRHLHVHPELSFQEHQTSVFISEQLHAYGIQNQKGIAGTGVVGIIHGRTDRGSVVALRADMDALPVNEAAGKPYRSVRPGVMHACGHDAHMASLLGTARIIKELTPYFDGVVKLIFQPAEELLPGGAKMMIEAGVLNGPRVDCIIAQHVDPTMESGCVGIRSGIYMASNDELYLDIEGEGGHAALVDQHKHPVNLFANSLLSMRDVLNRHAVQDMPHVLSFGKITAEGATNVVPERLLAEGTFRTFDEAWRRKAKSLMQKAVMTSTNGLGQLGIKSGYPCLINDALLAESGKKEVAHYLGKNKLIHLDLRMTAEDFAWFAQERPALFYRLGVRDPSASVSPGLHTPGFDIDEKALQTGMGMMAWMAVRLLMEPIF